MANNDSIQEPRFRVNRTASLQLTTAWQTINFNGTSNINANTFGNDPVTGLKMINWDSANQLVKFIGLYDKNYTFSLFPETVTNLVTVRASLQLRYVVPNGVSPGVDLIFPFVDTANPYADIGEVTLISGAIRHPISILSIPVTQAIRTNGVRVQMRISNDLITLGVCNLTNCALLIQ